MKVQNSISASPGSKRGSYDDFSDEYTTPRERQDGDGAGVGSKKLPNSKQPSREEFGNEAGPHGNSASHGTGSSSGKPPHDKHANYAFSSYNSPTSIPFDAAADTTSKPAGAGPNAPLPPRMSSPSLPTSRSPSCLKASPAYGVHNTPCTHSTGKSSPQRESGSSPAAGGMEEAPQNVRFVSPIFPQMPLSSTDSSSVWAIMLEQACQTLEAILGPLLEAILCECITMGMPQQAGTGMPQAMLVAASSFAAAMAAAAAGTSPKPPTLGSPTQAPKPSCGVSQARARASRVVPPTQRREAGGSLDAELTRLGLPLPPLSASACFDVLLQHESLGSTKFPVSMRRRIELVAMAVAMLLETPEQLDSSVVLPAQQAIKGIIMDCVRAVSRPSLLGSGSRQFQAFVRQAMPEFQSQQIYLDVLIDDCQDVIKVHEQREAVLVHEAVSEVVPGHDRT